MDDIFTPKEKEFIAFAERNSGIGYGNMMHLLAGLWGLDFERKGYPLSGVMQPYPPGLHKGKKIRAERIAALKDDINRVKRLKGQI